MSQDQKPEYEKPAALPLHDDDLADVAGGGADQDKFCAEGSNVIFWY